MSENKKDINIMKKLGTGNGGKMIWKASYITDIGTHRNVNQDSLMIRIAETKRGQMAMTAVADGMGGLQEGELASKQVILHLARWFENVFPRRIKQNPNGEFIEQEVYRVLQKEEMRLLAYEEETRMLGTTLTAIILIEDNYYMIHVGDSRCYLISKNVVEQLSTDHTFLAQEVREGRMTQEESCKDRRKNVLTECIGVREGFHYQYREGRIHPDDVLMLCSDGFWHELEKEDLKSVLSEDSAQNETSNQLEKLVIQVKDRGEKDNITAVLLHAEKE